MKFSSDLLYRLIRAQGSGDADPASQSLELPAVLLPTIQVPGPLSRFTGFSTTEQQRESFQAQAELGRSASQAAASVTLCTFSRGLWWLQVRSVFVADWSQAFTIAVPPNWSVNLVDPDSQSREIIEAFSVANVPQLQEYHFPVVFTEPGWAISISVGATGAGQTHGGTATIFGLRLN